MSNPRFRRTFATEKEAFDVGHPMFNAQQENCGNNSAFSRERPFDDLPSRVTRVLTTGRLQWHREETVERDIV
jgi:hypothetical protein